MEIGNGSEHAIQLDLFLYIISELFKYGYIAFVPEFFIESSKRQVAPTSLNDKCYPMQIISLSQASLPSTVMDHADAKSKLRLAFLCNVPSHICS